MLFCVALLFAELYHAVCVCVCSVLCVWVRACVRACVRVRVCVVLQETGQRCTELGCPACCLGPCYAVFLSLTFICCDAL